jgi:hypothetical protein
MAEIDISAVLQAEIAQARQQGQHQQESEPRATTAWFDPDTERLFMELRNGVIIGVPQGLLQGLAGVPPEVISDVEVTPSGYGLHWEALDVDLGVPQLVAGLYGTKTWMGELGRQGGKSRSAAKAKAARENGKRGGRPRKNPQTAQPQF